MHLIVGPNGAGKTTFYRLQLQPRTRAEFVNADLLAQAALGRWSTTRADAELGQSLAEQRREALIADRQSLVLESTFSHPSKLDLVDQVLGAGYRLVLYHLNVRDADFAVERVADREVLGGHPVPETNVRQRYDRNQPLIRQAMLRADHGFVFDNSEDGSPPRRLITFAAGQVSDVVEPLPDWAAALYADDLSSR